MSSDVYLAWLRKWSPDGNPGVALVRVREEVERKTREHRIPLEVRLSALEGHMPNMADFIMTSFLDFLRGQTGGLGMEQFKLACGMALEFLRLCALDDAIDLWLMAKGESDG